jgi:hypothetical protein
MNININPAPNSDGSRAGKAVIVGANNSKNTTRFSVKNQSTDSLLRWLTAAPNERHHPIICRHWPVASKQQLLSKAVDGRGGEI